MPELSGGFTKHCQEIRVFAAILHDQRLVTVLSLRKDPISLNTWQIKNSFRHAADIQAFESRFDGLPA